MAVILRSRREIELVKKAGEVVAEVLLKLKEAAMPGVSTAYLNQIAEQIALAAGAEALFKGVESPYAARPFPGVICTSINEQVVHGIPSDKVRLKQGDMLSIDYGARKDGYCADAAITVAIGEVDAQRKKLMTVTENMLEIAIAGARPCVRWSTIAAKMQDAAESAGFSVVTDFVGHGIGRQMHEDPKIPNFVSDELLRSDIILREGMIMAIEPMVNMGSSRVRTLRDGWTVVTSDGKCSAHYEHTIVITADGCEVLTKPAGN